MQLLNTNGMVLIGPGSEWFWAALSGIVTAVTLLAIFRQLRLQASQAAIEQVATYAREWFSERFLAYRLDVYLAIKAGGNPERAPDLAAQRLAGYWEGIGALVRKGHLDRRLLWDSNGAAGQIAWLYLGPWCLAQRAELKDSNLWEHFEWLAGVMAEMSRRTGSSQTLDWAWWIALLDKSIANVRYSLRMEQSLRTVLVASPEAIRAGRSAVPVAER